MNTYQDKPHQSHSQGSNTAYQLSITILDFIHKLSSLIMMDWIQIKNYGANTKQKLNKSANKLHRIK